MTRKNKLIGLQIIFITAFLLQPIVLPVRPDDMHGLFFSREILKNILANMLIIAFFYCNYFLLIPQFYFTKKYVLYFLAVLACLIAILFISSALTSGLPSPRQQPVHHRPSSEFRTQPLPPRADFPPSPRFKPDRKLSPNRSTFSKFRMYFTENDQIFFLFAAIVLFSLLLQANRRYYRTENAKQEAEINYLIAQINPHFLFNVLNSIYTLTVKERAPNSSKSLLKLSGLMRYIITETNQNAVPLEKEIACIDDYIDLQKLRLTDNVRLEYTVTGNLSDKQIAPMLLMPFIENAFKYGISTDEDALIRIEIDTDETKLKMQIVNQKVIKKKTGGVSGLGIKNVQNRLLLLYPDHHELRISETESSFHVTLKIIL